ncbi:hypothetical protein GCM10023322_68410 [Rugosimonospora acidiphila]|uniref:Uncharacterized protein n=1 Tax=Rugosimonospora acidiphila TaxID=556531 RepID=A0ABP9SJ71_9ACTN
MLFSIEPDDAPATSMPAEQFVTRVLPVMDRSGASVAKTASSPGLKVFPDTTAPVTRDSTSMPGPVLREVPADGDVAGGSRDLGPDLRIGTYRTAVDHNVRRVVDRHRDRGAARNALTAARRKRLDRGQ